MVLNPDVQRRAQADIDMVVDMDRLPDFGDRPSLPYIDAVVREVMRWRPVIPLGRPLYAVILGDVILTEPSGLPHATSQSDVYQGYYIPKGECPHPPRIGTKPDQSYHRGNSYLQHLVSYH
jgi:hypothetical protein